MGFLYWNQLLSVQQLLSSEEWQILRSLLAEFRRLSLANGIIPVIVFIPTKIQVYGGYFTLESGQNFLAKIESQLSFETNSVKALTTLTQELNLQLVNLMPHFKRLASEGKLLYYPFDTHWNSEGRQAAAEFVAASLLSMRSRARD
jgi:hypothetical protein